MKNSQNSKAVQLRQAIAALEERMTPSPAERSNGVDVQRQLQQNAAFKAQMLQRRAAGDADTGAVLEAAAVGVQGSGGALPHLDAIQKSFGRHDVSRVQAFVGGQAKAASEAIGAEAYATGSRIAFRESPTLHTAAHEAAHVVQQRVGVSLSGGVGQVGDRYERHADEVADRVVQGKSAEDLLDAFAGGGRQAGVQRKETAGQAGYMPGKGTLKGGFHVRPRVPGPLWYRAEAERMEIDTPVRAARDAVEALMLGRGLVGSMRPGTSAGARTATSMAGSAATGGVKMAKNGGDNSEEAILQRKWDEYLIHLAHFGYGLDPEYRIVDVSGRVVDTWWYDNLR